MGFTEAEIAIIVAIFAALPGLLGLYFQRRKDANEKDAKLAEATERIVNATLQLIEPLNKEISLLRLKLEECNQKLSEKGDQKNV